MPHSPGSPSADRNLLLGILALQMNFVTRDALIEAMHAWVLQKDRSLAQVLLDQGRLTRSQFDLLEAMVSEHLKVHQDDPRQSLAALHTPDEVRRELGDLADAEWRESLAAVSQAEPDAYATTPEFSRAVSGPAASLRYRVVRSHARGGLGEVFVAEDAELHREVALKELQDSQADDSRSRRRFRLEAEITGQLEHPGIVPVYGMGQHPNGRPFYAMRFIQGEDFKHTIERFHEADGPRRDPGERSVAFRQLLSRFVAVCNAVGYAHSRGVIHRDIKPSNVMVGKFGETLVVDWGLAKVVGRADSDLGSDERTLQLRSGKGLTTELGATLGTPAYMSPEQATGRVDELTQASDIYSLGATLYTLLTGQAPVKGGTKDEILSKVREGAWVPPRQAKKQTPPALDAVCRKAMAARPSDRYPTALALAHDVECWLADEPVSAWPEPVGVRVRRWMSRHRPLMAALAATLIVALAHLIAGAVLLGRSYERERLARIRAEEVYWQAHETAEGYFKTANSSPRLRSAETRQLRKDLLLGALPLYREFVLQPASDAPREFKRGEAYLRLATIYSAFGQSEQAMQAYDDALAVFEGLGVQKEAYQETLAETLLARGELHQTLAETLLVKGELHGGRGALADAEKAYDEARAVLQRLGPDLQKTPKHQESLGWALHQLGTVYIVTDRHADARKVYDQASAILTELARAHGKEEPFRATLAEHHFDVGLLEAKTGHLAEAQEAFVSARKLFAAMVRDFPTSAVYREELTRVRLRLAGLRARRGDHDGASREVQEVAGEVAADGVFLFGAACVYSVCSVTAGEDAGLPEKERGERARGYADQALASLQKAAGLGYFHTPETFEELKREADLEAVRKRPEFEKLQKMVLEPDEQNQLQ